MCAAACDELRVCVRTSRVLRRSKRRVRVPVVHAHSRACVYEARWGTDRTFHEGGDRLASPVCKNLYIT